MSVAYKAATRSSSGRAARRAGLSALLFIGCQSCAAVPPVERPKPPKATPPSIVPLDVKPASGRPAAHEAYLQAIYKQLAPRWDHGVRDWARDWLPKTHPANNPNLAVVVVVDLDPRGQPSTMRVVRSSHVYTIDNSALRAIQLMPKFPPLPRSLVEQRVRLRWAFFRDQRGCDPRFARIEVQPLSRARRLELALSRRDYQKVNAVLTADGPVEDARWALANAAFLTKDERLQLLALGIAPSWQLKGILAEAKTSDVVWNSALDTLIQRAAYQVITAVLEVLASPRYEIVDTKTQRRLVRYQLALLQALVRLGKAPAEKTLAIALRSPSREVVAAAASLTSNTEALDRVLRGAVRPTLKAQLAARRLRLSPHSAYAARILDSMLTGSLADRLTMLRALQNHPASRLLARLETIARDSAQTRLVRIEAVRAVARVVKGRTRALYRILNAKDIGVQLAVISQLPRLKNKLGASYRLAEIAYKNRSLAAAAVAALAQIGHHRFGKDIMWLTSRLSTADQARVVPKLPIFKRAAFPFLKRLLGSKKPELKVAALQALRKLDTKEARALVATLTPAGQEIKPEPLPPRQSQIEGLIRQALRLMKTAKAG